MFGFGRRRNAPVSPTDLTPNGHLIELHQVVKDYDTAAGPFTALKGVDLYVNAGEFVAVIGKSGSGKTTLINMITGIDRPSSGQVLVGSTAVHTLGEGATAVWRGRQIGVIFQFFQLLPTLTAIENVMLPMDFCNMYTPRQRQERAQHLLELVELPEQAHKLPAALSGGQQQRVAIARAMANDPPILMADEPTGNLDSKTSESVFRLFESLVRQGKTVLTVTHDYDLAKRVDRTIIVCDGEIIEEYLSRAFPALNEQQLIWATRRLRTERHEPGAVIIREGAPPDKFYLITKGRVEVVLEQPGGEEIIVAGLGPGQFFGELELIRGGTRTATIRATDDSALEAVTLDREAFAALLTESKATEQDLDRIIHARLAERSAIAGGSR
jgi:putative ABC transport system ATP-binding protein